MLTGTRGWAMALLLAGMGQAWAQVDATANAPLLATPAPPVASGRLFGQLGIKAGSIASLPKWTGLLRRMGEENLLGQCAAGRNCQGKAAEWFADVQAWRGEDRRTQMLAVQRMVNQMPYFEDRDVWNRSDYWATPREFLASSGDCEDYAITKYYSLKALGWPERDLRLVVLHDDERDTAHAVLAVRLENQTYILDNLLTEPLPDRFLRQYRPYYAVNAEARWVFVAPLP
jgi:predicted transglutaminase-like cysteine proteinase